MPNKNTQDMPYTPAPRALMVKNLCPGLTERGKIKIGVKGNQTQSQGGKSFQLPKKLDHFVVTTLERDQTGNFVRDAEIHKNLGDKPKSIPVRLLFDKPELNFQTRYACFVGRNLWCAGDGETALRLNGRGSEREQVTCPCHRQAPEYSGQDKCKINGNLSVVIEGVNVLGGVWKFRTTSYNSVVGILSSMALIMRMTGGILANIPLHLTIQPKVVTTPDGGQVQTIYVVGLEYHGSMEALRQVGYDAALQNAQQAVRIDEIENQARALLAPTINEALAGDDSDDVVEEWYPDQATTGQAANAPARPTRADFASGGDEPANDTAASNDEMVQDAHVEDSDPELFDLFDEHGVGAVLTANKWVDGMLDLIMRLQHSEPNYRTMWENNESALDTIRHKHGNDFTADIYRNHHLVLAEFDKAAPV